MEPIEAYVDLAPLASNDECVMVDRHCIYCRGVNHIRMTRAEHRRFESEHAQTIWPHASADAREALISGSHAQCFNEMCPEDDEEFF